MGLVAKVIKFKADVVKAKKEESINRKRINEFLPEINSLLEGDVNLYEKKLMEANMLYKNISYDQKIEEILTDFLVRYAERTLEDKYSEINKK